MADTSGQVVAFAAVLAGPAPADPPSHVPGGPCIEGEQTVQLSSVPSYEEVTRALRSIEASSGGRVEVASAGMSGEGRELWYATVGDGPDVFWLQARIHGNELHSTEAVLQILRYLGSSGSPEAALIRDRLTVIAIPMYNPDGATASIRQSDPVQIDLNRTGSCSASRNPAPGTSSGRRPTPDSRSTCTTWGRARSWRGRMS